MILSFPSLCSGSTTGGAKRTKRRGATVITTSPSDSRASTTPRGEITVGSIVGSDAGRSFREGHRFFELCREADGLWGHIEWAGLGLLTLGLRPIELMHARWENVNTDERMLWIAKSHGTKEAQARQHQPIPISVWPEFENRRQDEGLIWTNSRGNPMTRNGMNRMRTTVANELPGFQWKRFRKTYATILAEAGNDGIVVSRLLRHSLGGKAASIAQRHYVGQDLRRLREVVDAAFLQDQVRATARTRA